MLESSTEILRRVRFRNNHRIDVHVVVESNDNREAAVDDVFDDLDLDLALTILLMMKKEKKKKTSYQPSSGSSS